MLYLSLEAPICSLQTKYALIRLKNEDLTSQTVSPTLKDSSPFEFMASFWCWYHTCSSFQGWTVVLKSARNLNQTNFGIICSWFSPLLCFRIMNKMVEIILSNFWVYIKDFVIFRPNLMIFILNFADFWRFPTKGQ